MKFAKVRDVKSPERGTNKAAGIDFFVPNDFKPLSLFPQNDLLIPSGIRMEIPEGFMLLGADKSGVATSIYAVVRAGKKPKKNVFNSSLILGAKVIDEDYTGEIHIHVINIGAEPVVINPGMKIAQFILVPVSYEGLEEVPVDGLFKDSLSERGANGFGSTDK